MDVVAVTCLVAPLLLTFLSLGWMSASMGREEAHARTSRPRAGVVTPDHRHRRLN